MNTCAIFHAFSVYFLLPPAADFSPMRLITRTPTIRAAPFFFAIALLQDDDTPLIAIRYCCFRCRFRLRAAIADIS